MPEFESPLLADDTAEAAFDELLAGYFAQLDAGEVVDRQALVAAHPEFADELAEYFDTADEVERMAGPVLPEAVAAADALYGRDVEEATAIADTHPGVGTDDSVRLERSAPADTPDLPADKHAGETLAATVPAESSEPGLAVPRQFGRYIVERCLGQGAMGAVFLAEDASLGRKVAIKVPKMSPGDGLELAERFHREARAAAGLSHRNICPVYDVGEVNGVSFLTMAYIAGRPLKDFVHPEHLQPQRQVAAVVRKLALALDHAHRAGIVHRDLKPANIMIDTEREPVIMDFGLARRIDLPADIRVTHSGVIVGTPAYMPPEQVEGDHNRVGPASDIYSLGVILYELLTGDLPFKGSLASVLGQILSNEPPPPSLLRPDLDRTLEAICLKMMAKVPEARYASMRDVADALTDYLRVSRDGGEPAGDSARLPAFDREDAGRPVGLAGLRGRLHEQQQRAEALIRLRRYDVALRILGAMVSVSEPALFAYTRWAERELPRVREALAAAESEETAGSPPGSQRYESELEVVEPRGKLWYAIPAAAAVLVLAAWGIVTLVMTSGRQERRVDATGSEQESTAAADQNDRRVTGPEATARSNTAARAADAERHPARHEQGDRDAREWKQLTAPDRLTATAVTPDALAILAACADGHIYIWSVDEEGEPRTLETGGADVRQLLVSADGRRIAAAMGETVRVWNRDGQRVGDVAIEQPPVSVGVSADGSQVFAAFNAFGPRLRRLGPPPFGFGPMGGGDVIVRYTVETGQRASGISPSIGSFMATAAGFSADGRRAAVASDIGRMTIVDLTTFAASDRAPWTPPIGPRGGPIGMNGITLAGNGRRVLTFGAGRAALWDGTDGSLLRELSVVAIQGTTLSYDGNWLLTPTAESSIALWRTDGQASLATFTGHSDRISGLAFVPGRKLAVSASWDKTLRVWQLPETFVPSSAATEAAANQPRVPTYREP